MTSLRRLRSQKDEDYPFTPTYEESPASPSVNISETDAQKTSEMESTSETQNTEIENTEQHGGREETLETAVGPMTSQSDDTAERMRRCATKMATAKSLAEDKLKKLKYEAELIRKKLEIEMMTIELENNVTTHENPRQTREPDPGRTSAAHGEPHTSRGEPRYEHSHRDERNKDEKPYRSPTPSRSRGRGLEHLADVLESLVKLRPPTRQATELPIFTGAPTEWLPFKAAYRDSTANYNFSPMENLSRMRNALKGEARDAVSALLHTATDPSTIMRTLEQCFGRPEVIMDRVMEDIRRLPRPGNSASELNAFAIKLQNIVCVMKTLDRRGYLNNPMLTREVVDKLSPHLKSKWCDYAEEHDEQDEFWEPEIIMISKFLMKEADRALRYAYSTTQAANVTASTSRQRNVMPIRKRRENVYATSSSNKEPSYREPSFRETRNREPSYREPRNREPSQQKCLCCNADHSLPQCNKFINLHVERRWDIVKGTGLCFKCLKGRHSKFHCRARTCSKCERFHHELLHVNNENNSENSNIGTANASTSTADSSTQSVCSVSTSNEQKQVLLKVCPVIISGPAGEIKTHALFDEASTVTLIDEEIARSLKLEGKTRPLNIHGVNSQQQHASKQVKLRIRGLNESNTFDEINARTMPDLVLRHQTISENMLQRYKHLKELHPSDTTYDKARPKILIGADNWHLIVTRELRVGKRSEPAASKTQLGWVIHGTAPRALYETESETTLHLYTNKSADEKLDELLEKHFKIDALGVSLRTKTKPEDDRAIKIFNSSVQLKENRYEVQLPWREDEPQLPPSYNSALRRLYNIEKRMDKSQRFQQEYSKEIKNLLDKGYAEEIKGHEKQSPKAWYLPHFPVTNPNKPGKIRLVFDAAAKAHGVSLNDYLLEGPDLLKNLPGILFRFREKPVAITADVQEMFLRIKIAESDQPAQMFLWRDDQRNEPPKQYKMTSMIFGAASSPFLAHSVRNRAGEVVKEESPKATWAIQNSHYMDDWVDSFETIEEATQVTREVNKALEQAGFVYKSWNSNATEVISQFPEDKRAKTTIGPLVDLERNQEKTLGLLWDSSNDTLDFNVGLNRVPDEVKSKQRPPTKRETLSAVMSIYDPLGLISKFTIAPKILLQDLWLEKIDWDEEISNEKTKEFHLWLEGLNDIKKLHIKRQYHPGDNRQLHIFCDASERAFATVAYWRTEQDNKINVALASSKAKVAPTRQQTVPRLELQAAVIGTRLAETIIKEHRIKPNKIIYWTDSSTVLHWIRKDAKKYTPYVAHRLGEIAEKTEIKQWRWVPTSQNVADDATRPCYNVNIEDRWFHGPDFLYLPENMWPEEAPNEEDETEITYSIHETESLEIDPKRFSKWARLLNTVTRLLFFIDKSRKRTKEIKPEHTIRAEKLLIQKSQIETFSEETKLLKIGKPIPKQSKLYKLDPKLEDGIIILQGRINAAQTSMNKTPPIIDGKHYITKLIVASEHEKTNHGNNEQVVNNLRQKYWILGLRSSVKETARRCRWCQMRKATPKTPAFGDLPTARFGAYQRPFTYCGLDYFGPMTVTIGRRHEKRWGALFTCLTTRAVHIELVASLSTDSAIMAIRRMAARRGWPTEIHSDNGTNFRGANAELKMAVQEWEPALRDLALKNRINWKFIAPGAPHQGGSWERMVRSVKTAIEVTLNQKSPKEEILCTLLAEAEAMINGRPLTHVPVDPRDPEAITPNHFLLGSSQALPTTGECDMADRRVWRATQALADHLWQRWLKEYLPTLMPRGSPNTREHQLKEGDVVIIIDSQMPRNIWPRGIVTKIHPGPDGSVRTVEVRTRGGVFRRPASRLVVLPVGCDESTPGGGTVADDSKID